MTRRRGLDLSELSLAEIRVRLADASSLSVEGRLLAALRRDRRGGAKSLAEALSRRLEARRAET